MATLQADDNFDDQDNPDDELLFQKPRREKTDIFKAGLQDAIDEFNNVNRQEAETLIESLQQKYNENPQELQNRLWKILAATRYVKSKYHEELRSGTVDKLDNTLKNITLMITAISLLHKDTVITNSMVKAHTEESIDTRNKINASQMKYPEIITNSTKEPMDIFEQTKSVADETTFTKIKENMIPLLFRCQSQEIAQVLYESLQTARITITRHSQNTINNVRTTKAMNTYIQRLENIVKATIGGELKYVKNMIPEATDLKIFQQKLTEVGNQIKQEHMHQLQNLYNQ
eukprot:295196_1